MEDQTPSIKPIAYKYGVYSAMLSICGLMIMYLTNMDKNWTLSIASIVLSVTIFYYGIKEYKSANANSLNLGEAFKVGLAIALIGGILSAIYSYIHYKLIYPEFITMQKETAYNQIVLSNPTMSPEQISQTMSITELFLTPGFFSLSAILGSLIFGLIVSLILGLVLKND